MRKIATWREVNGKVGSTGTPANKCPTKAQILATGRAIVNGTYAENQLVQLDDVQRKSEAIDNLIFLSIHSEGNGNWRVTANAQYSVKSELTVSGSYTDDLTGREYPFELTIPLGSGSGTGLIVGVSLTVDQMQFGGATPNPYGDDDYNYIVRG